MTTETSNARGEWPERYACNGPEGTFWTDDSALANKLIAAAFDRDEWTVTDTQNPTGDAPPPAAARGDVRGLVARVAQLREAIESEPDHCFGSNVIGGRAYGVRENLLCIVGLIEAAITAAQQQGQAVATVRLNPMRGKDDPHKIAYLDADLPAGTKLYTAPPSAPVGVELLCRVYADAYHAGHHATVEGGYVDVLWVDRDTYWLDTVEDQYSDAIATQHQEPTTGSDATGDWS